MKIKLLFLSLFVFFTLNSIAQEFKTKELISIDTTKWLCTYNYDFFQDSTSSYSKRNDQMYLQVGSHLSKFSCVSSFISDSILYFAQRKNMDMQAFINLYSKSLSGVSSNIMSMYTIFKNYPIKGLMIFTAFDDNKFYKVEQPMHMNWRLDTQKDTAILGYNCQKAYTSYAGRNWVAWYSQQIPLTDGPYKFNGLPGLILKISDTKKQHCFTLNSIKKASYIQTINLQTVSFVDITAEEYIKIMKNKMMRLYGNLQNGVVTIDSEEAKAKALHGLMSRNNFIEKF